MGRRVSTARVCVCVCICQFGLSVYGETYHKVYFTNGWCQKGLREETCVLSGGVFRGRGGSHIRDCIWGEESQVGLRENIGVKEIDGKGELGRRHLKEKGRSVRDKGTLLQIHPLRLCVYMLDVLMRIFRSQYRVSSSFLGFSLHSTLVFFLEQRAK